jgi:hypothetical protein
LDSPSGQLTHHAAQRSITGGYFSNLRRNRTVLVNEALNTGAVSDDYMIKLKPFVAIVYGSR